jgi:predicted type IV restriction endonuclease
MDDESGDGERISELLDALESATKLKREIEAAKDIAATTEGKAENAIRMAVLALVLSFMQSAAEHPRTARRIKHLWVRLLRAQVSDAATVDEVEQVMAALCRVAED